MNKYLTPLKREVWEHHGSFITMPIIVSAILVVILLFMALAAGKGVSESSFFQFSEYSYNEGNTETRSFEFSDRVIGEAQNTPPFNIEKEHHEIQKGLKITAQAPYILFYGIMFLVALSFLLSSLIADRKDNSILFWKSMPVSETQNVINKVLIATFLLPSIAWLASFVMSIFILIVTYILAIWSGIEGLPSIIWQESSILATGWGYIGTYLSLALWLLPVSAWLLFASAVAKKNVFLTAILPIILIIIAEKYVIGSHFIGKTFLQHMNGLMNGQENAFMILNSNGWRQLLSVIQSGQFWGASIVASAFTYAAVWFRENRYEG